MAPPARTLNSGATVGSGMAVATGVLAPGEEARLLAEHMARAEDVHRAILAETIESGERGRLTESGRTACATAENVRGPLARYPRAVLLDSCPPVQASGIWHTHPAGGELRDPRHSLPDWANIVFGNYDVSIVSGTNSMQVITAGADQEAMVAAFQDAVGADVATKTQLVNAIVNGTIEDHTAAARRVESALSPLVWRRPTGFHDLAARADALAPGPPGASAPGRATAACTAFQDAVSPDAGGLRQQAREAADAGSMLVRDLANRSFDEALGIVAGTIVSRWLFNGGR